MADVLVHFGHFPVDVHPKVIFEPYAIDFDVKVLENAIPFLKGNTVILVTTAQHVHLISEMEKFLQSKGISCIVTKGGGRTPERGQVLGCMFTAKACGTDEVLFVGTCVFHPIGIALATRLRVTALDPVTGTAQEVNADTLMRRRFAVMGESKRCEKRRNHCQHQERPAENGSCPGWNPSPPLQWLS